MFKYSYLEAKEVFNRVVHSYQVLADDEQRRTHDEATAKKQEQRPHPPKMNRSNENDKYPKKATPKFTSHYYDYSGRSQFEQ
jgi:DnaJ-class molecular chaperone